MSQSGSGLLPRPGSYLTCRLLVRTDRAERSAVGRFPSCLGIYGLGGAALARSALRALTGPRRSWSRSSACCSLNRVAAWTALVLGQGGRCVPCGEHGPHDLSRVARRGAAPQVAERADHLQPAAGLGEGAGRSRHGSRFGQGRRPRTAPRVPVAAGRAGPAAGAGYRRAPAGHAAARWSPSQTPRSRCPGCCAPCPTGATWRR